MTCPVCGRKKRIEITLGWGKDGDIWLNVIANDLHKHLVSKHGMGLKEMRAKIHG